MRVAWFSAGVSSAVALKLARPDLALYIHIEDQHPDTLRFVADVSAWVGMKIRVIQSPYPSVESVCRAVSYINGPNGAPCTRILKRRVRQEWEAEHDASIYVWGMDCTEVNRADRLRETMPEVDHAFPLIDNGITKEEAHRLLRAAGIKRPVMYELGYNNNNCVGCVKGGMGYWNHIRKDFPNVFSARALMERDIGASCIRGVYLDELDPDVGRHTAPIVDDCGILCGVMAETLPDNTTIPPAAGEWRER